MKFHFPQMTWVGKSTEDRKTPLASVIFCHFCHLLSFLSSSVVFYHFYCFCCLLLLLLSSLASVVFYRFCCLLLSVFYRFYCLLLLLLSSIVCCLLLSVFCHFCCLLSLLLSSIVCCLLSHLSSSVVFCHFYRLSLLPSSIASVVFYRFCRLLSLLSSSVVFYHFYCPPDPILPSTKISRILTAVTWLSDYIQLMPRRWNGTGSCSLMSWRKR